MKELEELIVRIFRRLWRTQSFTAKVTEVDKDKNTCTVEKKEGLELYDVRLNAVIDTLNTRITAYPKAGSYVTCQLLNDDKTSAYVSQMSEVDEVRVDCENVIFNGGELGGLVKIEELVSKINALESKHDALVEKYNSHIHVTTATIGASATVGVISPTATQSTDVIGESTTKDELEDTKIKH